MKVGSVTKPELELSTPPNDGEVDTSKLKSRRSVASGSAEAQTVTVFPDA